MAALTVSRLKTSASAVLQYRSNSTGRADGKTADLSLSVSLPDLGVLRNGIGGQASFDASLKGPWSALDAALDGAGENVQLLNKDLDAPKFVARITFSDGRPQGDISMSGTLDGRPVGIHGSFDTDATGATILRDFNASSGSARASGSLVWPAAGHPHGQDHLRCARISATSARFCCSISRAR